MTAGALVLVFKEELVDFFLLRVELLDTDTEKFPLVVISTAVSHSLKHHLFKLFYLKESTLNLFNLQSENEVEPEGHKNKLQTNLSFRRKEMHLGIRHACCHGDSPNLCATAAH